MLWFLRLFSSYVKMEGEYNSLSASLKAYIDRNVELTKDCKQYIEQRDQAFKDLIALQAEASKNLKLIANWQAVQAGAYQVPFPEVHTPIVPVDDKKEFPLQQIPAPRTARTTQQEMVAESRRKAMELRNRLRDEAGQNVAAYNSPNPDSHMYYVSRDTD